MKQGFHSLAVAVLAAAAFNASAATQGTIATGPDATDTGSSGTVDITLRVAKQIIVKDLQNVLLETNGATPGQPIEGAESFCVGGIGFPSFNVDLTSAAATNPGEYILSNGSTNTLKYNVSFANNETATTLADGESVVAGSDRVPNGPFTNFGNLGCNSDNSTVVVSVPATEWEAATVAGDYTDTLTVLVSAN